MPSPLTRLSRRAILPFFNTDFKLISPYNAPASSFNNESIAEDTLRWRGAIYFAFIPTLFMIFLQGSVIYSESRFGPIYWRVKLAEPLLFFAPLCLLMAATGYSVAVRCANRAIRSALLVGCVVGAGWALIVMVAGNTIAQLNGAAPLTLDRVVVQIKVLPAIFMPIAAVLCVFTRWRGIKLGFVKARI